MQCCVESLGLVIPQKLKVLDSLTSDYSYHYIENFLMAERLLVIHHEMLSTK